MLEGRCLCGDIRFAIDEVKWCAHCHCKMCRRAHAAGYVTWVGVREEHFRMLSGELRVYHSSDHGKREFCGRCGSQVTFRGSKWPGEVHVPRALLPDGADLKPMAHAYWGSRAGWVHVGDELPRM